MGHADKPTRAELLEWLDLPDPGTSPDDYDLALQVALNDQGQRCETDPYAEGLHLAALRRAARVLAARGMSLGVFDSGDFGGTYLPRWDAEIETHEAHYRSGGFA